MEQRSLNWHEWRKLGLGASDAPIVMGVSPWKTPHQLWEEKTGRVTREQGNWATNRGNEMEPRARARLELELGIEFPPTLAEHSKFPEMRASLDGWNEEQKIVLEIKCPGKEDHELAASNKIPEKYYPQIQHQLFVTGGSKAYYYSYSEDDQKVGYGHLVEVLPDKEYIVDLLTKMLKFWKHVKDDTEPDLSDRDYKPIRDAALAEDLKAWHETKTNLTVLEKRLDVLAAKVLEHPSVKGNRVRCGNFKISVTTRKGNIQYNKIPDLKSIDLEQYRGKSSSYQTISYKEPVE